MYLTLCLTVALIIKAGISFRDWTLDNYQRGRVNHKRVSAWRSSTHTSWDATWFTWVHAVTSRNSELENMQRHLSMPCKSCRMWFWSRSCGTHKDQSRGGHPRKGSVTETAANPKLHSGDDGTWRAAVRGGKGSRQRAGRRGVRYAGGNTITRQQRKTGLEAAAE